MTKSNNGVDLTATDRWFELDVSGINIKLRIDGYRPSTRENWDTNWCKCDFMFSSGEWLKYHRENDEIVLSCEVDELKDALTALVSGELTDIKEVEFLEPDFRFVLHTVKTKEHENSDYTWNTVNSIYLEWRVYFWDGGITDNYLSVVLDKEEIIQLRDYLQLVIER